MTDFEIKQLQHERKMLVTLVNGVKPVVESFQAASMSQKAWKHIWLETARESIARYLEYEKSQEVIENEAENLQE